MIVIPRFSSEIVFPNVIEDGVDEKWANTTVRPNVGWHGLYGYGGGDIYWLLPKQVGVCQHEKNAFIIRRVLLSTGFMRAHQRYAENL